MKLIAHRGFSKYELENTKEAFLAAANRPYFGIETDISIIKNQAMILFHDDNLKRLTNIDKSLMLEKHIIPIVIKLHILKNISEYVNIMVKHLLLN